MNTSNADKEKEQEYNQLIHLASTTTAEQDIVLEANLSIPKNASGVIIFAHGSGSRLHSPRNRYVAQVLQNEGIATLLIDLLTEQEEEIDLQTCHNVRRRVDIECIHQKNLDNIS